MANLYPYIFSNEAQKQAEFYEKVFNGEIVSVQTFSEAPDMPEEIKDRVMHLVLKAGGQTFFMADDVQKTLQTGTQIDLVMEFETEEEAKQVFNRLSDNGEVLMPFDKMFWGAMFGRVQDQYGVRWQITTTHS